MFVNMYRFGIILSVFVLIEYSDASAIPMWEYLSKQEKMSFLYSMFATQVENFCDSSSVPNCNQNLLKYGLNKLKQLPEEYLDSMDPYQRGGSSIIWDTMMAGHPLANSTPKPARSTTTPKPNSYEDEPYSDFEFGSHGSASARIDNVVVVPAPKDILNLYNVQATRYPQQVGSALNLIGVQKKGPYTRFQEYYPQTTSTTTERATVDPMDEGMYQDAPLTGPMVVRVYLDGTPVEDSMPLPQDEDLKQYKMSQIKIPNL